MKKITTLALLPIIALTSCNKDETNTSVETTTNTEVNSVENENIQNETLNENISVDSTDTNWNIKKTFILKNDNGTILNGTLEIADWKVMSINFIEDINSWDWPAYKFAKKITDAIVWKEISNFTIPADVVSWASWVAYDFNDFLNTLK